MVTKQQYRRDLARGLTPDETMRPGEYTFVRGGFLRRNKLTPEEAKKMRRPENVKVDVHIKLDLDVFNYFKTKAAQPGALPYQTQINQTLRRAMEGNGEAEVNISPRLVEAIVERVVARVGPRRKGSV